MSLQDEIDALRRIASRRTVTPEPGVFDRASWPVPDQIKGASRRSHRRGRERAAAISRRETKR